MTGVSGDWALITLWARFIKTINWNWRVKAARSKLSNKGIIGGLH